MRINTIKGHEQTIKVKVDKFDYLKIKISLYTYHEQSKNPIHIKGENNWNPYNPQIISLHNNRKFQWGYNNNKKETIRKKKRQEYTLFKDRKTLEVNKYLKILNPITNQKYENEN